MPEIITRADAIAKGLKRYFTGLPCKRGHVCERVVSTKTCVECKRAAERFENMTPKQIEKRLARERVANMTPERHKKALERRRSPKTLVRKRVAADNPLANPHLGTPN